MRDSVFTVRSEAESKRTVSGPKSFPNLLVKVIWALGFLVVLIFFGLGPVSYGRLTWATAQMGSAHNIGNLMLCYALNHQGKYPDGNSSTEVFQKLIDEASTYGYPHIDPTIFYVASPGKIPPVQGVKLKPENVCWDVTSGVDSSDPDSLPLVFLSGYKVTYAPGGAAVPRIKPFPPFVRTWAEWWDNETSPDSFPGIAVYYKTNYATFLSFGTPGNSSGFILNFVPQTFDAKGKTYRQLTPDGPLP